MKKRSLVRNRFMAALLAVSMLAASPFSSFATTSEELQEQQKKLEKEKKELEKQKKAAENEKNASQNKLNEANDKIDDISDAEAETQDAIDETQQEIVGLMADIELIKEDIEGKQVLIEKTNEEYEAAKAQEETLYAAMVDRVKFMYEKGNLSYMQILLTATSYSDALNKAQYVEELYEYDRIKLAEYIAAKNTAEAYGNQLDEEKAELEASQYELEEEQNYMEQLLADYKAKYADYEVKLAKAKQDAAVYTAQVKSQQASIATLQKQLEAKQKEVEAAKKAAEAAKAAEDAAKAEAEKENGDSGTVADNSGSGSGSSGGNKSSGGSGNTANPGSATGGNIAAYACRFVGNPYVPGGTSLTNGADCSGFVQSVYKAFGISVPRTSWAQGAYGKEVSYANAQPGDVIYYGGHVGIYIGGGQIVHASTQKTGIKYSPATYRSIISVRRFL
ncbi:C40 family peptidase [Butyrivibrio sp. AE3009]|uniref:C40 family peptidase n=1 Tax=Butyrivibrio sp. AE3009 TaxID=1280666 RepID=UPI0003B320E3|nr:C40 family peptidase [Butyrivibrio sp. AE3009]